MKNKKCFSTLNIIAVCALATGLCANAQAEMYRSVTPDGKVVYTDRPPTNAKSTTTINTATGGADQGSSNRIDLSKLPDDVRRAYNNYPVNMYSSGNCESCNVARTFLNDRGIPFNEYTVTSKKDFNAIKDRFSTDDPGFPILTIGSKTFTGYDNLQWDNYLNAAGFPKTSKLPSSYSNPPARPLTTMTAAEKDQETNESTQKPINDNSRSSGSGGNSNRNEPLIKF